MADVSQHPVEKSDEKGSVEGNSVDEDFNRNITDPEILEAIMASLKEAEDALEKPDTKEETESEDQVEETVEITKMDLQVEERPEVLDSFVFSDITDSSSLTKGVEVKVDEVATVDTKKQQVLQPVTQKRKKSSAPLKAPIPLKKARGRPRKVIEETRETCDLSFSEEELEIGLCNGDTDYRPGGNKSKVLQRKRKSSLKKVVKESVLFACAECSFQSEILGELKIHGINTHEGCEAPSYLDMAEAAIAKLEDSSGVVEMSILKEVLFDNFDSISDEKSSASQFLSQALRAGVKLGRLQMSRKGRGQVRFRVVTKEQMKLVVEKWRVSPESVELVKSGDKSTLKKIARNKMGKVKTIGGSTKMKHVAKKAEEDDDYIEILNESLTSTTRLRLMKTSPVPHPKVQIVQCLPQNTIPQSGWYEDDCNSMLTCPVCYCSFWYEDETSEHARIEHEGEECVEKQDMHPFEMKGEQMVKERALIRGDQNVDSKIKYQSDDYEKLNEHEQGENKQEPDDNGNMLEHPYDEIKFDVSVGKTEKE